MANNELTLRDKNLIEGAANGLSGDELEARYGIPAAQAIVRVRELLAAKDVWDQVEQRKLLMHSVFRIKEQIETEMIDTDKPKETEAYLRVINTLSMLLDKQGKISSEELEVVTRAQAKELLRLVEAAYVRARDLLTEEYGMLVDVSMIDDAFHSGLREALLSANTD